MKVKYDYIVKDLRVISDGTDELRQQGFLDLAAVMDDIGDEGYKLISVEAGVGYFMRKTVTG